MKTNLAQLFDIFIGVGIESKIGDKKKPSLAYEYRLTKIASFRSDNLKLVLSRDNTKAYYSSKQLKSKYVLKKGDVLLKVIGDLNSYYIEKLENNQFNQYIFSSNFIVLRSKNNKDYFSWQKQLWFFLNSQIAKKAFYNKSSTKAGLKYISISDISKLEIENSLWDINKLNLLYKLEQLKELLERKKELVKLQNKYYLKLASSEGNKNGQK